jgi:acyl-CoA dehydrogenase
MTNKTNWRGRMSDAVDLDSDLFELAMSAEAQPLMDAVQRHIAENVEPIVEEFYALNNEKTDRWSWHPRQLELLEGSKKQGEGIGPLELLPTRC